jgi:flagellar capping protein FliD
MEAQVWTLIAVLIATLIGVMFQVGTRMDSFAARLDRLNDRQESRFDRISKSFERVDKRFDRLEDRMGTIEEQGHKMADAIYSVAQKLDEHLRPHAV